MVSFFGENIVFVFGSYDHFSQCFTFFFSPSFVTMSSSKPIGVGRMNNSYQEPIFEDCYCKGEEQCDSEVESENDGWLGMENHWCPLLDLSYHFVVGPLVGIFGKDGLSEFFSNSSVCQKFIAPIERHTITEHVW